MVNQKQQTKLTGDQKREAVQLFKKGVTAYTDISKKLAVPYKLVNSFMTKWKYRRGILKKRSTRSDKKPKYSEVVNRQDLIENEQLLAELKFLRKFYGRISDVLQSHRIGNHNQLGINSVH
jgi:hypothetical protein